MLNELMLAQQIETMQRLHLAWIEFEAQPDSDTVRRLPRHGVRHGIAATLVRLGTMLDRTAAETATPTTQSSANQEVRHAL
jgi:hypothetical protein